MAWLGFKSPDFVMRNPSDDYIQNANTNQAIAERIVRNASPIDMFSAEVQSAKAVIKKSEQAIVKMVESGTMTPDPEERSLEQIKKDLNSAKDLADRLSGKDEERAKKDTTTSASTTTTSSAKTQGNIYEYGASLKSTYPQYSDQDLVNYLLYNPDLREYAEAQGLYGKQAADWARAHWNDHGIKNEGRINKPGSAAEMGNQSLRNQAFDFATIPKAYADLGLKSRDEIFKWHLGQMTPSELWEVRKGLDSEWNLQEFNPEGWRYQEDIPYGEGLLGNTLALSQSLGSKPVGQLIDTEERRFLQDRFEDKFIDNDFPSDWVTDNKWQGPPALEGYWDTLTGAVRDDQGILKAAWDRPYEGWGNFQAPEDFTVTRVGQGGGMSPSSLAGQNGTLGGLVGSSREVLSTPYTRPELQDWSHLMPEEGLLRSQAQRSVVANQGANFQPWAQGGLMEYSPAGTSTYIPPTYTSTPPPVINDPTINPPADFGALIDFNANLAAQHEGNYENKRAAANLAGFYGLGATTMNPEYVAYQNALRGAMGLAAGETFDSGNWGTFNNMTPEQINAESGYVRGK